MRILYINPNSTQAMTDSLAAQARAALPEHEILAWTNTAGPPAIQGEADGAAAIPGLLALLPKARAAGAEAIIIACFDDTGLQPLRAAAHCPVIGIGQAAFHMAALLGARFSVVTTLAVSLPVIAENLQRYGLGSVCAGLWASGLPVLALEEASPATRDQLAQALAQAGAATGGAPVVLGCAGMAALAPEMARRTGLRLIDGVVAAGLLAPGLARAAQCFAQPSPDAQP